MSKSKNLPNLFDYALIFTFVETLIRMIYHGFCFQIHSLIYVRMYIGTYANVQVHKTHLCAHI